MASARIVCSPVDRLRVLRVAHAATALDQPFETYAALRLRVPRRHEADWWVLEAEGEAVSSLMCYPLRFRVGSERVDGYGLGAVATHPDHRKQGHASNLCRTAARASEAACRTVGLLYSAIPPALYERLGFRVLPAWQPLCRAPERLAAGGEKARLTPLDAHREAAALAELYRLHHAGLHLDRDDAEMRRSLDRHAQDVVLGLGDPLRGYVRLTMEEPGEMELVECIVPSDERPSVVRAVADLAARLGRKRLVCWLDPDEQIEQHFEDEGRAHTLPMVRGAVPLEGARFWSSDHF